MSVLKSPDCLDGSHKACSTDGWCEATEHAVPCPCDCHQPQEHYEGCPCPPCVNIRAARPQPTDPIDTYLCCGVTMRLTPIPGGWTGQTTHLDHCPGTGAFLLPETKETR
ncbi:hypothetical protein SAMN04489740_2704 [Arthrobacter alpinus]|uniref:Uncharacterized protein n=1 Tax=Arthrobacter alpinus TaxID=656366 RepID=A0A1H5M2Y1_9MICC|nr:hypothetical protein SAMN04489740_2704 [Arthrobacter alpinus]